MDEVTRDEFRRLRDELRETRDIARAVLMRLVGKDRTLMWEIEAKVVHHSRERRYGTDLTEVIGHQRADRIWREFEIAIVPGLRRLRREEVEALPGIGPDAMGKLDTALAEQGTDWAEAA